MPRPTKRPRAGTESLLESVVAQIDQREGDMPATDTVPTGFGSLDRILAGGLRRKDLVVLSGDVGSGKSALALAMAVRAAGARIPTMFFSGEMSADRVLERALALEGRAAIDDMRQGRLDEESRASVGAAAVRLRHSPLVVRGGCWSWIHSSLPRHRGRPLVCRRETPWQFGPSKRWR